MQVRLLLAVALVSAACTATASTTLASPSPSTTLLPPAAPLSAESEALVLAVEDAIDGLLGAPVVAMNMELATESSTATAVVDNRATALESHQETRSASGGSILTDRILIDDTMFVRIFQGAEDVPEWTVLEIDAGLREEFVTESYTAFGTLGASLDRIIDLARNVPVVVEDLGIQGDQDLEASVVQFVFEAEDIRLYLAQNDLELVGPFEAEGRTVYEFWVDGSLHRLAGAGTQFHDGEAIEDVRTRVDFAITPSGSVSTPG